ncbi:MULTISPECIES: LLM class flavin-dependent oxidoreductase [Sphingobacterium]|uniref:LLM class flavin-dependent oxidoreductase n=1 Tax=Sphingobacterium populi TaxID=1812824 RepID=A0ABW5U9H4_9SPHI|nr:LLM class flavin-dependent oxidoreductase [Sphingobacterium sp. CFCC 11742]
MLVNDFSISVLDIGSVSGINYIANDLINYAQEADRLNFNRFTVGEHYNSMLPWYSPDMLIPILAGVTERIKIGVSGISLRYHSPYKVALDYKLVSSLYPDRISLGITKGKVSPTIEKYLNSTPVSSVGSFEDKLQSLIELLSKGGKHNTEPFLPPFDGNSPELWLLGSSLPDINIDLLRTLNFTLSYFHQPDKSINKLRDDIMIIKDKLMSIGQAQPRIGIAIAGLCLDDPRRIRKSVKFWSDNKPPIHSFNQIVGSPESYLNQIMELCVFLDVYDLTIYNIGVDINENIESINHVSSMFKL